MIELVFVIVVLGILAAIAVPKLAATREDAQISKGAADVSAIRSGIVSVRQKYLLRGMTGYINTLSCGGTTQLFDGNCTAGTEILMYPVTPKNAAGHWRQVGANYVYKVGETDCTFTYSNVTGRFDLNSTAQMCKDIVGE